MYIISFLIVILGTSDPVSVALARYLPVTRPVFSRVAAFHSACQAAHRCGLRWRRKASIRPTRLSSTQCAFKAEILKNPHYFDDSGGHRGSILDTCSLHFCSQIRFEIVECFKGASIGTKKTLYSLHEKDDRTFVLIEYLLSSTTHRPTFLFDTILNNLYICGPTSCIHTSLHSYTHA